MLPDSINFLSQMIPVTHGLEVIRKVVIYDSAEFMTFSLVLYLLSWSVGMFVAGMFSVNKAVKITRVSGESGRY